MVSSAAIHPFELAGLGKAPFRFIGLIGQDLLYGRAILNRDEYASTGVAVTTKPGGSCDYCGTYIINMFRIRSADGRTFKVGCDCVTKTGDAGLIQVVKEAVREANHRARAAKSEATRKSLPALILAARRGLRSQPHPQTWGAEKGLTRLDWALWMARNAGNAGRSAVVAYCRKAIRSAA